MGSRAESEFFDTSKNPHIVALEEQVRNGQIYGEIGKLEITPDGERFQCHLCGRYFKMMSSTHLYSHGLENGDAYRDLLGLQHNQPLCSPKFSDSHRKINQDLGLGDLLPEGNPFKGGYDLRRSGPPSEQEIRGKREVGDNRRADNVIPISTVEKIAEARSLGGGNFTLYGESYFFSKKADHVEIVDLSNNTLTVKGVLKNGSELVKTYKRKK